jgi:hypothetical protein
MVRSRDARRKCKASSPPYVPPPEVDVAALRQHQRAAGERRSKAREDLRRVHMAKTRELSKHGSPLPKQGRVIEVSTSEEAAEELERSRGHSDREQSWGYVFLSRFFFTFWLPTMYLHRLQMFAAIECRCFSGKAYVNDAIASVVKDVRSNM